MWCARLQDLAAYTITVQMLAYLANQITRFALHASQAEAITWSDQIKSARRHT